MRHCPSFCLPLGSALLPGIRRMEADLPDFAATAEAAGQLAAIEY
jgi:hypothetical protein